jgi:transcriptional regulator with XRE-family HTH domain
MLSLKFATVDEICRELGSRLKAIRLAHSLLQTDLAVRAGVSAGTVKKLENSGQSTTHSLIRIVQALGREDELQNIFVLQARTIADMERNEAASRRRASRPRKAQVK